MNSSQGETNADKQTPSQKSTDYYAEKACKEFEQLLEARKSQKDGRWTDPILRRLLVEEIRCNDRISRDSFYKWIISNKDEDGDNLFDDIYAEKNEYCIHNSGYFMYKNCHNECHMAMKFTECIALKEISAEYLPLYAKCDIEVRTDFQVRFYQDDKYIAARKLMFK